MVESLTTELNFGKYSSGFGYDPDTGISRKLIWINNFTPSSLFGVSDQGGVWDLTDRSCLFQDNARTLPVLKATDPIASVLDASGKGNHLIVPSNPQRPLYQGYGLFDGVDDWLASSVNINMAATDKATVIISARVIGVGNQGLGAFDSGVTGFFRLIFLANAAPVMRTSLFGSVAESDIILNAGDTANTVNRIFTFTFDIAGTTATDEAQIYVDHVQPAQSVSLVGPAGAGNWGSNAFALGSDRAIAQNFPFSGRIYRAILINRLLTATERTAAETWCGQPAGIA